jgi:hypothetical protein
MFVILGPLQEFHLDQGIEVRLARINKGRQCGG